MDPVTGGYGPQYDLEAPVLFFPIRHHSPACAFHLAKALDAYQPDAILIEGPADTGHLLPHIAAADTKAPICIYYSCTHEEKNEEGEPVQRRSACYYPLLDFSPELVAIRHGAGSGIPTAFVDLPYSHLSLLERQRRGKEPRKDEGKNTYYSDYYLARSAYIQRLCQKQGCRDYGELWEKLFELGGLQMETPAFVASMLALCHFSRVESPPEMLQEDGTLEREAYMAWNIAEAMKSHSKVLVLTGGFHTATLAQRLREAPPKPALTTAKADSYLIPYSMAESDQLSGYASGMPYPAFYQQVYTNLLKDPTDAYDKSVLHFLVRIGGALRKRRESTSIADEIAALFQSYGLAQIRDKPQQGVYELLDGVRSAYVKGQTTGSGESVLRTTVTLLRGDAMGQVTSDARQIPLLLDFQEQCARFRLKTGTVTRQESTLDILSKPRHRETSAFFHRLDFLGAGFGKMLFGPDYRKRDTARIREKWQYASSAKVQSALVDVSYLGGTVREAASSLLARKQEAEGGCGAYSRLLIDAAVMALTEHVQPLLAASMEAVAEDGSFLSLAQAAANLLFLENARWLLNLPDDALPEELLGQVYYKSVSLLPSLATKAESEDRELAKILKELYQISRRDGMDGQSLEEALLDLVNREDPPPCLQGSAAGLLYAAGTVTADDVLAHARAYLMGSGEMMKLSGRFLGGLFLSAWDILFAGDGFLDGLGHVLRTLPQEDFLALLPDLRLAFSVFTPTQIDRIGDTVAKLLGVGEAELAREGISETLLTAGRDLDAYGAEIIGRKEVAVS